MYIYIYIYSSRIRSISSTLRELERVWHLGVPKPSGFIPYKPESVCKLLDIEPTVTEFAMQAISPSRCGWPEEPLNPQP